MSFIYDKVKFVQEIETLLELPESSLKLSTKLADIDEWDSLAILGLIALVNSNYGRLLPVELLNNCETILDICDILSSKTGEA